MSAIRYVLALLALVASSSQQAPTSDSYVAAVVEYSAPWEGFQFNIRSFHDVITTAGKQKVDILVFPEIFSFREDVQRRRDNFTRQLAYRIPDPKLKLAPCDFPDRYAYGLRMMSCMTRLNKLYVVLTINECANGCRNVSNFRFDQAYRSVIALDRDGRVVARNPQRNYLLVDRPSLPDSEPYGFDADFGLRFALLGGDDLMKSRPVADHLERGVVNFILSTGSFQVYTHGYKTQYNAGWAYAMGVNLLVASTNDSNVDDIDWYTLESGIYTGKQNKPVETNQTQIRERFKLITARLPISHEANSCFQSPLKKIVELPKTMKTYSLTKPVHSCNWDNVWSWRDCQFGQAAIDRVKSGDNTKQICSGDICCIFVAKYTEDFLVEEIFNITDYSYKVGMFSERRKLTDDTWVAFDLCSARINLPDIPSKYSSELPPLGDIRIYLWHRYDNRTGLVLPMVDRKFWTRASDTKPYLWTMSSIVQDGRVRLRMEHQSTVGNFGLLSERLFLGDDGISKDSPKVQETAQEAQVEVFIEKHMRERQEPRQPFPRLCESSSPPPVNDNDDTQLQEKRKIVQLTIFFICVVILACLPIIIENHCKSQAEVAQKRENEAQELVAV